MLDPSPPMTLCSSKDTSNFLPGHGGILDRVDGMLVGLPIGFITLIILY